MSVTTPPIRFERLRIRGYRRLADVSLEMRPLTVVIGANGAGKTSLLEAWSLLSTSADGGLDDRVSALGGFSAITTKDGPGTVEFDLSNHVDLNSQIYNLKLVSSDYSYSVRQEGLVERLGEAPASQLFVTHQQRVWLLPQDPGGSTSPTWEIDPSETFLSQVPKTLGSAEYFRRRLASSIFYDGLDVRGRSPVRLPQTVRPTDSPGANGEDLVACLYRLRDQDEDRYEVLTDTLSAAFRDFERLKFPPVAAGTMALEWKDKRYSQPFHLNQLSSGTLRFLWLATLLLVRTPPAVTLIDEPETSLHPELLSLLVDLFRGAATRAQLIVATQSDRLIRFLRPEEVLVADLGEDGKTKLTRADEMDIEHWLEDFSLDQLHEMGRLGGRS